MKKIKWSFGLALGAIVGVAAFVNCSSPPPVGGTGGTGGCVENVLCIQGDHWDPVACRCVPDADAGAGVPCGSRTCAADEQCCSPSCGICGIRGGLCPAIACADVVVGGIPCGGGLCGAGQICCNVCGLHCQNGPKCPSVPVICPLEPAP